MREARLYKAISYIILFLILLMYIIPILFMLNTSLKTQVEFFKNSVSITTHFHWENYILAWKEGKFSVYIWNSLLYTSVSTVASVLLALFAAFPVARKYVAWTGFFYLFFLVSQFLPNPIVAQFMLMKELHLYDNKLGYILLRSAGSGIVFMLFAGYIKSISRDLDEAAGMDGCGYFRYMFQIVVPLIGPILATGTVLTAIGTWNDLITPTMYLSASSKWPITAALINFQGQYGSNWPLLACGAMIIMGPIILLYVYIQKYIINGALAGAVKS
jgi:raffinose/stachyose/melibiose transport system permease protein